MKEEVKLWYSYLKNYSVPFNRFKIIDKYIADFYCDKARLAIELCDDPDDEIEQKEAKKRLMESLGVKMVFFKKESIIESFDTVCEAIDFLVEGRMQDLYS